MSAGAFCVNPWVSLHVKHSSGFNPCCLFKGIVASDSVDEYINSSKLKSVKTRLLNGEKIPECSACWAQEQVGYVSKRQRDNQKYTKIFQALNRDPTVPNGKFVEYYLRLGNHCNLRCTSCGDAASSGWISENKKFNIPTIPVVELHKDADVWNHLKNNASTIGAIEFIGGEPFMINVAQQAEFLKWLVDNNHAKHIRIKYNTNGTRMPTEQLNFWKFFKAVEINLSVDGIGTQFEYLRFPADWSVVDANIKQYQHLQSTIPQLELTIITTISIMTIGYIDRLLKYCKDTGLNLFVNMLEKPEILNLYNFDAGVKTWIADRIKDVQHPVIRTILDNLHTTQPHSVARHEVLEFLDVLDLRRGLDVRQTFPELTKCLESAT